MARTGEMGIDIRVKSETGQVDGELFDPENLTKSLLADYRDESSPCLRWVDPYGDTTFNQLQVPYLIDELNAALEGSSDPKIRAHCQAVLNLVLRAKNKPHTYVSFSGD